CTIESFTTMEDLDEFPLSEDYESYSRPDQPDNWTTEYSSSAEWFVTDIVGRNSNNCLQCSDTVSNTPLSAYYCDMDSWIFTGPLELKAGMQYNMSFYYRVFSGTSATESLAIMIGTEANSASMTNTLFNNASITTSSWTQGTGSFTPSSDGYYYVGFHAYSTNGLGIFIDDFEFGSNFSSWLGSTNNSWGTSGNWNNGLPGSSTNVIISSDAVNFPTITSGSNTVQNIIIQSGASLIGAEYLSVSGTSFMQRNITAYTGNSDGWHIISPPTDNMLIDGSDFEPGETSPNLDDLYIWQESSDYWMNFKAGAFTEMDKGTGYLYAVETTATKDFTGTFNDENVVISNLSYTPSAYYTGWHMIGNPFQSPVTWNNGSWSLNNVEAVAKILKPDGTGYTDVSSSGTIAANQGFFIRVTGAANGLTIPLSARTHTSATFYKNDPANTITMKAYMDENRYFESNFILKQGATTGFDEAYDGHHLGWAVFADMYSVYENDMLSTNHIPFPGNDPVIVPLHLRAYQDMSLTMKTEGLENLDPGVDVFLEDHLTGSMISLREIASYPFMSSANDDPGRFVLHFKTAAGVKDIPDSRKITSYIANANLYIHFGERVNGTLIISNAGGKEVIRNEIRNMDQIILPADFGAGLYLISLVTQESVSTGKVVVTR
ncbi:MAG: choice-of-anchor J domain-containing protein, partial [Bacteroidetes bacterium]|nr:choice-of-anchor J domain-containing protein [Bacteroidota bacterium]